MAMASTVVQHALLMNRYHRVHLLPSLLAQAALRTTRQPAFRTTPHRRAQFVTNLWCPTSHQSHHFSLTRTADQLSELSDSDIEDDESAEEVGSADAEIIYRGAPLSDKSRLVPSAGEEQSPQASANANNSGQPPQSKVNDRTPATVSAATLASTCCRVGYDGETCSGSAVPMHRLSNLLEFFTSASMRMLVLPMAIPMS